MSEEAKPLTGSALILAGGQGKRIGYDKKKLELAGERLLPSLVERLGKLFNEVFISSNNPTGVSGLITLPDSIGEGPMAGIYQGLLRCTSEYLYVVACDMPFINTDYIAYMQELLAREGPDVCIARHDNGDLELFNSFYKKSCAAPMGEALSRGIYKIRLVFDQLNVHMIHGETLQKFGDGEMFFNINYKEDLEQAERNLQGRL
ncbi:molybdopterin-guanine dinucleotide biosynthesis protein A [Treponema primitia ZAS-2]|uniref:Probable molybdenum cofactor guanylyltransferase n=1 Tax=Treponema primitia (strain ATCC BAA-887 / DSM 12427 / ZAS-2) TaxID=545694 RepID=D8L155_TREPZ|nr:molybdenum cofactor guanylyltransferase [Treponema primitia]ADJ19599.1 putative molybdopterin-guanine dinucleotide biosynthesis protein A [Treponema primitia ZAS-2]AEF85783.1 molybdopterin-guanine dinucleotide biosynthesis protein A [Treponema primitia ZAS-2]AEL20850.1 FdhD [Treponema primitia ZAS-2]